MSIWNVNLVLSGFSWFRIFLCVRRTGSRNCLSPYFKCDSFNSLSFSFPLPPSFILASFAVPPPSNISFPLSFFFLHLFVLLLDTPLFVHLHLRCHPLHSSFSLPSGLSKDGDGSANAESLEEVLKILAEEGSDWIYGFFTSLFDVVAPAIETEEEVKVTEAEVREEGGATSSDEVREVILDLQNQ